MGSLRNSQSTTEHPEYTEKHKIVISEGEMVSMDGQLLKETKQLTTVTSDDPAAPEERMYKEHTRTIGEREYQVREVRYDGNIHKIDEETELSEEEITQFLEEWSSLWVPSSTDSCVVHYSFLVKYRECDRINKTNEIR
jgi:hypothetical protein